MPKIPSMSSKALVKLQVVYSEAREATKRVSLTEKAKTGSTASQSSAL